MVPISEIKEKLESYFTRQPDYLVVGIYGSYAKNKTRPDSDIDICVARKTPLTTEEKITLSTELSLLLKKEIDLLDLNSAHGVILTEALHDSIWIRKDVSQFAFLLKKMLLNQADFQPYYERMLEKKRERFLKK